jgi:hypothetical protein
VGVVISASSEGAGCVSTISIFLYHVTLQTPMHVYEVRIEKIDTHTHTHTQKLLIWGTDMGTGTTNKQTTTREQGYGVTNR